MSDSQTIRLGSYFVLGIGFETNTKYKVTT